MGRHIFTAILFLIFTHINVAEGTSKVLPEPGNPENETEMKGTDASCLNAQYDYKKFRPEALVNLPFPLDAMVEIKKCEKEPVPENQGSSAESAQQTEIENQESIKKLSLVLSYIYKQQKNLDGSYRESDQAYQELFKSGFPHSQSYDHAVTNYEDALKNYGEYEAYLSALPKAVSEYEKKAGSSFKNLVINEADAAITMKTDPARAKLMAFQSEIRAKTDQLLFIKEVQAELESQDGKVEEKNNGKKEFCNFMGGFSKTASAENIVLASLNPMGAILGASLGATVCSEDVYENLTQLPKRLGKGLLGMGSYIASGLKNIGSGLAEIGREYFQDSPSNMGAKISEHYQNTKNWLNRKLGWN